MNEWIFFFFSKFKFDWRAPRFSVERAWHLAAGSWAVAVYLFCAEHSVHRRRKERTCRPWHLALKFFVEIFQSGKSLFLGVKGLGDNWREFSNWNRNDFFNLMKLNLNGIGNETAAVGRFLQPWPTARGTMIIGN